MPMHVLYISNSSGASLDNLIIQPLLHSRVQIMLPFGFMQIFTQQYLDKDGNTPINKSEQELYGFAIYCL